MDNPKAEPGTKPRLIFSRGTTQIITEQNLAQIFT